MQTADLLTKGNQFVLFAFTFPTQNLSEQGSRTRCRQVALHARLAEPACNCWFADQQPRWEPRVILNLACAWELCIKTSTQRVE